MPTTIKEALSKWEEKNGQKAPDAVRVDLYGQIPPIEKMDAALSTLSKCEQVATLDYYRDIFMQVTSVRLHLRRLSLSTNCIEKITNLHGLKNLRILSLGRNNIKSLAGVEAVSDTLEQLWMSYNNVEKMKGINLLKKLKILYFSYNIVKDWGEFVKLNELPQLEELVFIGNPIHEKHAADGDWVSLVSNKLKTLKKLDGFPIIRESEAE